MLEDAGRVTWGEGEYEIRRDFDKDTVDRTQWSLNWYVYEQHEPDSGFFGRYAVELDETGMWGHGKSFRIWYNSPDALTVPISRESLERGFLIAASTRGPAEVSSSTRVEGGSYFREGG